MSPAVCPSGLSVSACIREARDAVCPLYRVGWSWVYSVYCPTMRARRVSEYSDHWRARGARSCALLDAALSAAGIAREDVPYGPDTIRHCGGWAAAFARLVRQHGVRVRVRVPS